MTLFTKVSLFLALAGSLTAGADGVKIVEFHIKPGTGSSAWNRSSEPIVVSVGQTLRFFNDDQIKHFIHTDGAPCPHGTREFGPGEIYDCVISKKHDASLEDIYDHNQGPDAQIFIQAN